MKKLLLHTCCAPCSVAVVDELRSQYDLTVYFFNPNIFPEEEYLKRKAEVVRVCEEWRVPMIDADYAPKAWDREVTGFEREPEMGARCPVCFVMRLRTTAEFASQHGFEVFATSLTSGRNKIAAVINPIGECLAAEFGLKFLDEDWKTGGRQERAHQIVEEKGIYRQNYCGCKYSIKTP
jgi:predicted adenine nucleotide alpha hydrolase (AANH) superfamily ATPase